MIDFKPLELAQKPEFEKLLFDGAERGCEHSFVNLYIWGRQSAAFHQGNLVFFSHFNRKSVYPFPVGKDLKPTLDAIIEDAKERGIACRLTGMTQDDCALLERLYPGQFRYHFDRDFFDYVYDINELAELAGRKHQKKRNHLNRFLQEHPDYTVEPIANDNLPDVEKVVQQWYENRLAQDPTADLHMEKAAIQKALRDRKALGMEGLLLRDGEQLLAMTMGNRISEDTFDVNFEKAVDPGAYPAINREFARYLREKHPDIRWLNREDDMGLEGLRKAKLAYYPDHMIEKHWACLLEDGYDY